MLILPGKVDNLFLPSHWNCVPVPSTFTPSGPAWIIKLIVTAERGFIAGNTEGSLSLNKGVFIPTLYECGCNSEIDNRNSCALKAFILLGGEYFSQ